MVSLNFAAGASMVLKPEDYLLYKGPDQVSFPPGSSLFCKDILFRVEVILLQNVRN